MRNYHVMAHPKKPELGFLHVALNKWAKYRRSGFEFVSQKDVDAAQAETLAANAAQKDLDALAEKDKAKKKK